MYASTYIYVKKYTYFVVFSYCIVYNNNFVLITVLISFNDVYWKRIYEIKKKKKPLIEIYGIRFVLSATAGTDFSWGGLRDDRSLFADFSSLIVQCTIGFEGGH